MPIERRATPRPTFESAAVIRRGTRRTTSQGRTRVPAALVNHRDSRPRPHVLEELGGAPDESTAQRDQQAACAADVMYCVLEGEPLGRSTGRVRVVPAGDQVLFRRDTWHHGFNPSRTGVLEFFAPPPDPGHGLAVARGTRGGSSCLPRPALVGTVAGGPRRAPRRRVLDVVPASDAVWGFASDAPTPPGRPARRHRAPGAPAGCTPATWRTRARSGRVRPRDCAAASGELWVTVQEQDGDRYATDCLQRERG